ncbi:MAG TPA: flippase, partial [Candidatus Obscuribacterales bacterium]
MFHKLIKSRGAVNAELAQILGNTGWLLAGKILRLGVSLLMGTWVARYLRPEGFGQLQYALVFASFFDPLSTLTMGPVITRDLVRQPESSPVILGTAFALQVMGGVTAAGLSVVGIVLLAPGQPLTQLLVAIIALKYVFNSFQPIENWFEARVASKYVVWAEHGVFLLIVLFKCGLLWWQAAVVAFALAIAIESCLYGVGLVFFYTRQRQSMGAWRTDWGNLKYLFKESWPLVLSSTAVVIYLNIDQIMLGNLLGKQAVGIYASAATLAGATSFLPVILGSSLYPRIIQSQQFGPAIYHQRLQQFYDLNAAIAYGLIIVLLPLADFLISHLYGAAYGAAIPIFGWLILSALFT